MNARVFAHGMGGMACVSSSSFPSPCRDPLTFSPIWGLNNSTSHVIKMMIQSYYLAKVGKGGALIGRWLPKSRCIS
ncbi:hypothetical protein CI102_636 [Trichoderma harzianum]|nr:hypothetical protein CI102_636 [Trichoderma harzianum]